MSDHGIGHFRWIGSCFEGVTIDSEMEDYELVEEQKYLVREG